MIQGILNFFFSLLWTGRRTASEGEEAKETKGARDVVEMK